MCVPPYQQSCHRLLAKWRPGLNFARTAGGFIISYFQVSPTHPQPPTCASIYSSKSQRLSRYVLTNAVHQVTWAQTQGAAQSLGVQAAICAAGLFLFSSYRYLGEEAEDLEWRVSFQDQLRRGLIYTDYTEYSRIFTLYEV